MIRERSLLLNCRKVEQEFFKDRSIYYSTFAIQEQAKRGDGWQYELKGVYTIGILDFTFDKQQTGKYQSIIKLMDEDTCEVFYHKLTFVYLEMPKFTKTANQLETHFDKWLYIIRNLHKMEQMPEMLKEQIFLQLFEQAEIARYDTKERRAYEDSKKYYLDLKSAMDTSFKKGEEKGLKQGIQEGENKKSQEVAKTAIQMGLDDKAIQKLSGLSQAGIDKLRKELNR